MEGGERGSSAIPESVMNSVNTTLVNVENLRTHLLQFLSLSDPDVLSEMPPLQRAQALFTLAKATTTLFALRLRCSGVHPDEHRIKSELERLSLYQDKLERFIDLSKAPLRPSTTLNSQAATRFIEHSLPDLTPGQRLKKMVLRGLFRLMLQMMTCLRADPPVNHVSGSVASATGSHFWFSCIGYQQEVKEASCTCVVTLFGLISSGCATGNISEQPQYQHPSVTKKPALNPAACVKEQWQGPPFLPQKVPGRFQCTCAFETSQLLALLTVTLSSNCHHHISTLKHINTKNELGKE
ncbi:hypothetical protein V6N12_072260 [Hibiscus sabdariffa]|uniref:Nuclear nucleic acid-binding protein C1D n=1 Tax=Hibiscus sabdariffa TaxID=183260 RepID=A0ABR2FM83_9ROSI